MASGEERIAPLFSLGHCERGDPVIVQDVYRGLAYSVPDQVDVQPFPQCTYSATTTTYSSSSAVSADLSSKAGSCHPTSYHVRVLSNQQ
jgi:hypothetical protein